MCKKPNVLWLQKQVSVLPESHHKIEYNLYPLVAGLVALPQLKLTVSEDFATTTQVSDLLERSVPPHVYIMVSNLASETQVSGLWEYSHPAHHNVHNLRVTKERFLYGKIRIPRIKKSWYKVIDCSKVVSREYSSC